MDTHGELFQLEQGKREYVQLRDGDGLDEMVVLRGVGTGDTHKHLARAYAGPRLCCEGRTHARAWRAGRHCGSTGGAYHSHGDSCGVQGRIGADVHDDDVRMSSKQKHVDSGR